MGPHRPPHPPVTGLPFLLLLLGIGVLVTATTMLMWNRWPQRWAPPLRLACLVAAMVGGALVAGDEVNRVFVFYGSFAELAGHPPPPLPVVVPNGTVLPPTVEQAGRRAAAAGHGLVLPWAFPGPRSHVNRDGYVYLPAAYFDAAHPTLRFPVIELFHGSPDQPHNWIGQMRIQKTLDAEIAAGRIPPVVAVMPATNDGSHDRECVNAVRGQQDETYLAVDVPADVTRTLRVRPDRWAAMGYSTGGYCAVNLSLHHPDQYAAAVSLSGYFTALTDATTGDLYRGDRQARLVNSPIWWVTHRPLAGTALDLVTSRADTDPVRQAQAMRATVGARLPLTVVVLPGGGHNYGVWSAETAPALDWLAAYLPAPAPPPLINPGATIYPPRGTDGPP
jgi:enterochelin esterase-like enzyme